MELKKYKLGELGKVITGKTPKTNKKENFDNGEIPFYTPEDIAKGIGMTGKNDRFITEIGLSEIKNNSLEDESVLVGCIGSDMGNVAYTNHRCAMNQQINAITSFKDYICPLYVYYYLSTKKPEFRKIAGATTTPILPKSVFCDYIILLPKYHIQRKIASVLYNIDRKIELNRAINQNLEKMAKQLYDYWFVQFDFPNEEGKPYKSSGGKMVWNETLKREIPNGWEILQLGKICSFRNGINYSKDEVGKLYPIVNVRNISATTILLDGEEFDMVSIASNKADNYILTDKDIIIARSGCPGATRLLQNPQNTLFCGFIICCTPKDCYMRSYLTYVLKGLEGSSATTSGGSILQNISQDTLKSLWVILPKKNILQRYDEVLNYILKQMYSSLSNTKELTKQRNELLPLLMNGQISPLNCD